MSWRQRDGERLIQPARLARASLILLFLAGCAGQPPAAVCLARRTGGDTAVIIDHGWHTDIGIPADEMSGPLSVFRSIFPGARSFVFSYGKRTFLTAAPDDWSEYILGPIPGPAAILVIGLSVPPEAGYEPGASVVLPLPDGGAQALSAFLWRELAKDTEGGPRLLGRAWLDGGQFYAASTPVLPCPNLQSLERRGACGCRSTSGPHGRDPVGPSRGSCASGRALRATGASRGGRPPVTCHRQGGRDPSEQTVARFSGTTMTWVVEGVDPPLPPLLLLQAATASTMSADKMR